MNLSRRSFVASALSIPAAAAAAEPSWSELVRLGKDHAAECTAKMEAAYKLSEYERWDFNAAGDAITFSTAGRAGPSFTVQYAGSVSKASGTWLWSWANADIPSHLSTGVERVRDYGVRRNFRRLAQEKWKAGESDGWEMAAISNYVMKGLGIYRFRNPNGWSFMVFTGVRQG
jgi:hypothetical protein